VNRTSMKLARVRPASVGRMAGATCLAFGALVGLIGAVAAVVGVARSSDSHLDGFLLLINGVIMVLAPVVHGAIGFLCGSVGGAVYNLVARFEGGIECEIELPAGPASPVAAPPQGM